MAADISMKGNLKINEGYVTISVNPKIYPLDVVISSAYAFTEKCYCLIDGDPNEEIIVELRPKDKKTDLEELGMKFNNELVLYASYAVQSIKNQMLREAIIDRVLMTNGIQREYADDGSNIEDEKEDLVVPWKDDDTQEVCADNGAEDDAYLDDPEGIAIPWEEKYGKEEVPNAESTNKVHDAASVPREDINSKDESKDDDSWLDDPEGIAIPWEEKYGKNAKDKS